MDQLNVHPDISQAETLPAWFYKNPQMFDLTIEKVFTRTWQYIGTDELVDLHESVFPFRLLEHCLNEPLLLVRNKTGSLKLLSNVCTHRANILVHHPSSMTKLICRYHGRRFSLDGRFESMPEFQEAQNFPRPCDHLFQFPLENWEQFLFTAIQPAFPLSPVIEKIRVLTGFLPLKEFVFEPSLSKEYLVHAHWALYCENYLEGFHIPYVHKDLNNTLDYGNYTVETDQYFSVQKGYASGKEDTFNFSKNHPDSGKQVAAYYFWIFPNTMFNFYPWGLSVNIVIPISPERTRVSFLTFVYDHSKLNKGAGALLDKVEREDEFVVEGVQRGIQSRVYQTGRYSPKREQGVHHFHRLLADFINH
ncbi:MAG: Rieske 2Fe-2S domain-containing protein [Sphingobacteriales bacterium]|nr:MAG: Rieske 2Fe-2S domain-containing protein [Sphingobacteriales bacterium]